MKKYILLSLAALTAVFSAPASAHTEKPKSCAVTGEITAVPMNASSQRITLEITGKEDGPDVILIPGLSTPRDVWEDTVRRFAGCYRIHLVQVRGFGDAPGANAEGPVLEPLMRTVGDYIDDMIFDAGRGKPKIIGHSFGGLIAMKVGLAIPQKTDSIMVVDTLPFFGVLFGPTATVEQIEPQAKAMRSGIQSATQPGLDARTLATMSRTAAGQAQVGQWVTQGNPMVAGQVMYEVMTTDIRADLLENQIPITMLYPINPDSPFPADMTESNYKTSYAPVPGATVKRIDDSAHFIMLDQPETFAAEVEAFLKE